MVFSSKVNVIGREINMRDTSKMLHGRKAISGTLIDNTKKTVCAAKAAQSIDA